MPPEIAAALPMLIISALLISIPFALAGYFVARKRGLSVRYWTMLGFVLGPLVLPLLLFAKKRGS